jgi:hypothetical protein
MTLLQLIQHNDVLISQGGKSNWLKDYGMPFIAPMFAFIIAYLTYRWNKKKEDKSKLEEVNITYESAIVAMIMTNITITKQIEALDVCIKNYVQNKKFDFPAFFVVTSWINTLDLVKLRKGFYLNYPEKFPELSLTFDKFKIIQKILRKYVIICGILLRMLKSNERIWCQT